MDFSARGINPLSTKHVVQQRAVDEMGALSRARVSPDQLAIQVHGHGAHVGDNVLCELDGPWQDVLWLRDQLGKDAVEDGRVGGIPLPRRQEICRVAVAHHPRQEEGAARLHGEADAGKGEAELGGPGSNATIQKGQKKISCLYLLRVCAFIPMESGVGATYRIVAARVDVMPMPTDSPL